MISERQFDGLTIEEQEAYLERRENEARARAIGSIVGNSHAEHHAFWIKEAQLIVREDPELIFRIEALSRRVLERSNDEEVINPRTGHRYKQKTIYNHLYQYRLKLLEGLSGRGPGALAMRSFSK